MSCFTRVSSYDAADSAGSVSDALTANALTVAGAAGLAGVGVMSLAVTATVLPAQTVALAGASTALVAAGRRQAQGKSIVPDFGSMFQRKSADASTETVDVPATAPAAA